MRMKWLRRWSWWPAAWVALSCGLAAAAEPAETEAPAKRVEHLAPPMGLLEDLGLRMPPQGTVEPGKGRRVIVPDEMGNPVVARIYCRMAGSSLVMLPSGRLKSVDPREATSTERPSEPLKAAELLERLHAGSFQAYKTATSAHYAFVYGCEEKFYQVTRDLLESVYDGVTASLTQWTLPVGQPEVPLVVLIFPDRESFDALRPMPANLLAYYDQVSNFVVLHEDPELSDAAPEFALKQAAYTIAHEGVHQILHNVGVQQRLAPWPAWLSEGLPELFCPVKISSSMAKEGADGMPRRRVRWTKMGLVNDLRMYDLLRMRAAGGALLQKTVTAKTLDANGYAIAWALTHYLSAKQSKALQDFLLDVAAIGPLADRGPAQRPATDKLFAKHFGDDFEQLEAKVAKYLKSPEIQSIYRDPAIYQTHYVVVHTLKRGRAAAIKVMITTSPDGARKWKAQEQKSAGPGMQHAFRTQACETRQQAETLLATIGRR